MLQNLLSSSVDKTARLWRVGHDHCLRVYSHNNYGKPLTMGLVCIGYYIQPVRHYIMN